MRRRLVVAAACLILAAGSWTLYVSLREKERAAVARQMNLLAQESAFLLRSKLEHSTEVLHGIAALFELRPEVGRAEFRTFVGRSLLRQPELKALEWILRVPEVERGSFEQAFRDDGIDGFQFTEKRGDVLVRAAARDEHFPVMFVEPLASNEEALGFDLAANPERRRALERARDTGNPARPSQCAWPRRKRSSSDSWCSSRCTAACPRVPRWPSDERRCWASRWRSTASATFGGTARALAAREIDVSVFDRQNGQRLIHVPPWPRRRSSRRTSTPPMQSARFAAGDR